MEGTDVKEMKETGNRAIATCSLIKPKCVPEGLIDGNSIYEFCGQLSRE